MAYSKSFTNLGSDTPQLCCALPEPSETKVERGAEQIPRSLLRGSSLLSISVIVFFVISYNAFADDECPLCKSKWCCQCVLGKIIKNIESAFEEYSQDTTTPNHILQEAVNNDPMLPVSVDIGSRTLNLDMFVSLTLDFRPENYKLEPKKELINKRSPIKRWKNLTAFASSQKEGSVKWYQAWQAALKFALDMTPFDYHFNLNAAIALTRLGNVKSAIDILQQQLEQGIIDLQYRNGVLKQLGFLYYYADEYECSVEYYIQALPNGTTIPESLYQIIRQVIEQVKQSSTYNMKTLEWFSSLTIY